MTEIEIIAHRGFSSIAPENTLIAFKRAIEAGADSVELDVQLSADKVPVVFHDETLDRITCTSGICREKTLKQLKELDAGVWFKEEYKGETIPTLKEALSELTKVPKFIYIEVKKFCFWSEEDKKNLFKLIEDLDIKEKCIITSFNHDFIDKIRDLSSGIKSGYIVAKTKDYQKQIEKAEKQEISIICGQYNMLLKHPELVDKSQGVVENIAWTVDEPEKIKELKQLGVTRIVTNRLIGEKLND